jgi:hypothetical protein
MGQIWDPATYDRNASFVSELGAHVVELLAGSVFSTLAAETVR